MPDIKGFEFYIDAFNELGTCRPPAFSGTLPIPFTAIVEYSKIYKIEDTEEFHYMMRLMDNTYLEIENSKPKK